MNYYELFCTNFRKIRKLKGLTQPELAEAADVGIRMISDIENFAGNPTLKNIDKCAQAMNVHPIYFSLEDFQNTLPYRYDAPETIIEELVPPKGRVLSYESFSLSDKPLYRMTMQTTWDRVLGILTEFGIEALDTSRKIPRVLDAIPRISTSKEEVSDIVHMLNTYEVSLLHFRDVVEDHIVA